MSANIAQSRNWNAIYEVHCTRTAWCGICQGCLPQMMTERIARLEINNAGENTFFAFVY